MTVLAFKMSSSQVYQRIYTRVYNHNHFKSHRDLIVLEHQTVSYGYLWYLRCNEFPVAHAVLTSETNNQSNLGQF